MMLMVLMVVCESWMFDVVVVLLFVVLWVSVVCELVIEWMLMFSVFVL